MESNLTDEIIYEHDYEELFTQISNFINGPLILLVVIFGLFFNSYAICILNFRMLSTKGFIRTLAMRYSSSLCDSENGSSNSSGRRKRRPRIYIHFLWLTFCDTALLVSSLFMYAVPTLFDCYNSTYAMAIPFWYTMCNFTFSASVFLMLALMFERYRTLCCQFSTAVLARHSSVKQVHLTLAIVTLVALAYSIPRYFEFSVQYNHTHDIYLTIPTALMTSKIYIIGYRIVGGVLFYSACPYIFIFIMSFKVWKKTTEAYHARTQMKPSSIRERENLNSERIFFAITIKFLISRLTSTLFDIIEHFVGAQAFVESSFAMLCVHVNNLAVVFASILNFFIFLGFSPAFKKSAISLVTFGTS